MPLAPEAPERRVTMYYGLGGIILLIVLILVLTGRL
jgi:hypothetical protein